MDQLLSEQRAKSCYDTKGVKEVMKRRVDQRLKAALGVSKWKQKVDEPRGRE